MIKKIGFACKVSRLNQKGQLEAVPEMNFKTTTVSWLSKQSRAAAEQRLWDLAKHNLQALYNAVAWVSRQDQELRFFRIGSDCLPLYTHDSWKYFWQRPDVRSMVEKKLALVGQLARSRAVRLSMHPGQFCCLVSDSDDVVARSIEEVEYHADLARCMGYGNTFQDFKINVHLSGARGAAGFEQSFQQLSPEARNMLTIENDEFSAGLDDILQIGHRVALVFDIHHHFIHSHGEHLLPTDTRFQQVLDSWRGVRPVMHYSISREEYMTSHPVDSLPSMQKLLEQGHKRGHLRKHSDGFSNQALNSLIKEFWEHTDIMCETKHKNLSSFQLYNSFKDKSTQNKCPELSCHN